MERHPLRRATPPRLLTLAALGLCGGPACSLPGYVISDHGPPVRDTGDTGPVPAIAVDPREIEFGEVDPAVWPEILAAIQICNRGAGVLHVPDAFLDPADPHFAVGAIEPHALEPEACTQLEVTFLPEAGVVSEATLWIESDDPAAPEVDVPVSGSGS